MSAELIFISGGVSMPQPRGHLTPEQLALFQDAAAFDLCVSMLMAIAFVLLFRGRTARKGPSLLHVIGFPIVLTGIYLIFSDGAGWGSTESKASAWRYFAALPPYVLTPLGVVAAGALFALRRWKPVGFGIVEIAAGGLAVWFAKVISGGHAAGILIGFLSGAFLMATGLKTALDNWPDDWREKALSWSKHIC